MTCELTVPKSVSQNIDILFPLWITHHDRKKIIVHVTAIIIK